MRFLGETEQDSMKIAPDEYILIFIPHTFPRS